MRNVFLAATISLGLMALGVQPSAAMSVAKPSVSGAGFERVQMRSRGGGRVSGTRAFAGARSARRLAHYRGARGFRRPFYRGYAHSGYYGYPAYGYDSYYSYPHYYRSAGYDACDWY